ncbi:MAG TPA: Gfo/Idh/MocA family oxidoreductase [Polyangium sp.]|nr:Gfo/Idh/MocA family oxidoreductase [Polyangium sp.]
MMRDDALCDRRMLRLGLVGIGDAGKHHARVLSMLHREGTIEWNSVCVRRPEASASLQQQIEFPENIRVYPALDALLAARECDALILATPDGLHAEQVEKAAACGVAMLVEKPFALSEASAVRALAAAERAGVHVQVGYHLRYHRAHQAMVQQREERVGKLRSVLIRWAWPDPAKDGWRARGVDARFWSLAALGTHAIDLAMMLAGSARVTDVMALCEPHAGVDHAAEVSFRLGEGTLVHVSTSILHRAVSRVFVAGDRGEMEATGTLGARGAGELGFRSAGKPMQPLAFEATNPYETQVRDFVSRIPQGYQSDPHLLANVSILDRIAAGLERRTG